MTRVITGIVLILIGLGAGFGPQIVETLSTGFPAAGIGWMQTSGFVVAAIGAVLLGTAIGRRRARRRREREEDAARVASGHGS